MLYAEDAALRREVWTAAAAVGTQAPSDNRELIRRILAFEPPPREDGPAFR